jgi:hypothetical protein
MQYQQIARAEVMERYPSLYPETNSAYKFEECRETENDVVLVDAEELAARKEEATRKVREKLEALMKQQAEAKAIKETEEMSGDSTLDSDLTPQDNHSDEPITDLALVNNQQSVSVPEEEFKEKQQRGVILWKEATTNQIQQEMAEALKAARLDEATRKKVHEELLALFRRKSEMQGVKTEVEKGLLYEDSVAVGALDGADDGDMRQLVDVVGCDEERNVSDLDSTSCRDIVQWQGRHEDVLVIEEGVECMNLAAE